MALEYRDIYRREAVKATIIAANQIHERIFFYSTDGMHAEDGGFAGYTDDTFAKAAPNFDAAGHALFTLDWDFNPQMPIGEEGIYFRHHTLAEDQDIDLILVDNDLGNRANWPKLWWDHSESAFEFKNQKLHLRNTNLDYTLFQIIDTIGMKIVPWKDNGEGGSSVGYLAIGNITPLTDLDVDGDITVRGLQLYLGEKSTAGSWIIEKDGSELQFERHDGAYAVVGKLDSNGLFYGTGLKALDATGLCLYEKDGNLGIYIDDSGNVAVGASTILTNMTITGSTGLTINGTTNYSCLRFAKSSSYKWFIEYIDDGANQQLEIYDVVAGTNALYLKDNSGDVVINRFTMLGETVIAGFTAVATKNAEKTGTTADAVSTSITCANANTKVLSVDVFIEYSAGNWVGPGAAATSELYVTLTSTDIVLWHGTALRLKAYKIFITYKE